MNLETLMHYQLENIFKKIDKNYLSSHWDNTPMGEEWHTDFLITNPISGEKTVVQTLWFDGEDEDAQVKAIDKAIQTNQLYLSSGCKTLWLIEKPENDEGFIRQYLKEVCNVNMPMFYFTTDDLEKPNFYVGGWRCNSENDTRLYCDSIDLTKPPVFKHHFNAKSEHRYLSIEDFFMFFFMGVVRWSLEKIESAISLALMERSCWKCNTVQNVVKTVNIVGFPFKNSEINNLKMADIKTVIHYSDLAYSPIPDEIIAQLNSLEWRKKYNYGLIKSRYSKTIDDEYLSTGCVTCGALQGQHFIDHVTLNPQEYTHTELLPAGLFEVGDQETYEQHGEWIFIENEHLEIHQYRNLAL